MERRNTLPVCRWAAEDIPTVKAQRNGCRSLTTAELLSIIIGSGTVSENSVELSRRLLAKNANCLKKLAAMPVKEMTDINGIGDIKASKILAALELGARMNMEHTEETPDLGTAARVYNYMAPRIALLDVEEFWVIYLSNNSRLITTKRIGVGGLTEVTVDVRIVMREALLCNATIIIACHNHPSGHLYPSKCDDDLTRNLKNACETMRIHLGDHVIVTDGNYYSYREQGKL